MVHCILSDTAGSTFVWPSCRPISSCTGIACIGSCQFVLCTRRAGCTCVGSVVCICSDWTCVTSCSTSIRDFADTAIHARIIRRHVCVCASGTLNTYSVTHSCILASATCGAFRCSNNSWYRSDWAIRTLVVFSYFILAFCTGGKSQMFCFG